MNRLPFLIVALAASFMAGRVSTRVDLPDWINVVPIVVPDDPLPVPGEGRHLVVIYEYQDRPTMTAGQREIMDSVLIRKWLADAKWDVRYLDDDTEFTTESEWFKTALSVPRESLPWVVLSNGERGYSGPLPETVEEFKTLVGGY